MIIKKTTFNIIFTLSMYVMIFYVMFSIETITMGSLLAILIGFMVLGQGGQFAMRQMIIAKTTGKDVLNADIIFNNEDFDENNPFLIKDVVPLEIDKPFQIETIPEYFKLHNRAFDKYREKFSEIGRAQELRKQFLKIKDKVEDKAKEIIKWKKMEEKQKEFIEQVRKIEKGEMGLSGLSDDEITEIINKKIKDGEITKDQIENTKHILKHPFYASLLKLDDDFPVETSEGEIKFKQCVLITEKKYSDRIRFKQASEWFADFEIPCSYGTIQIILLSYLHKEIPMFYLRFTPNDCMMQVDEVIRAEQIGWIECIVRGKLLATYLSKLKYHEADKEDILIELENAYKLIDDLQSRLDVAEYIVPNAKTPEKINAKLAIKLARNRTYLAILTTIFITQWILS